MVVKGVLSIKLCRAFPFNEIRDVLFDCFLIARRLRRLFEDNDVDVFVSFCLVKNGSLISVNHGHQNINDNECCVRF